MGRCITTAARRPALGLLAAGILLVAGPASAGAGTAGTPGAGAAGRAVAMAVAKAPAPKTSGTVQAFMTLYGYVDNSPPGAGIAHPCIHQEAGGTGTYADPITFATDASELPWCEIVYVPYMERYFIHEDECSECDHDWRKLHKYRFDMWAGGDPASRHKPEKAALLQCESTWTRGNSIRDPSNPTITLDPPADLPVVTAPIFSPPTTCWTGQ